MHSIWAARIFHFLHERKGKQPKSCIIRKQMHATVIVIIPRACWKDPYDFTSRDVLIVFRINVLHQIRRQRSGHRKTRTRNVSEGFFFSIRNTSKHTIRGLCNVYETASARQPVSPWCLGNDTTTTTANPLQPLLTFTLNCARAFQFGPHRFFLLDPRVAKRKGLKSAQRCSLSVVRPRAYQKVCVDDTN